jgi:hypothetical protein
LQTYLRGAAGALLVLCLFLGGSWLSERYREFVIMREVVAQIIQAAQQTPPGQPVPLPEP